MAARKTTKTVSKAKTAVKTQPKRTRKAPVNTGKTSVVESPMHVSTVSASPRSMSALKKVLIIAGVLIALYLLKGLFVVSLVNGKPIYRFSVVNRLEQLGGQSIVTELTRRYVVEDELANRGITITQEEIDQEIDDARKLFEAQGVNFEDALAQDNLTLEDVREISRYQKGLRLLAEDGAEEVSDEEVAAYFVENKDFYENQTFDDVKDQIKDSLNEQNLQTREQTVVQELLQNARITTFKAY